MFVSASSAGVVAKFATIAGGVFIEDLPGDHVERTGAERCWRFDSEGRAEYALLADLQQDADRARWFGHQYTERDFILA